MLLSECDYTTIRCNLHRGKLHGDIECVTVKSNESNQIVDFHIVNVINWGMSN